MGACRKRKGRFRHTIVLSLGSYVAEALEAADLVQSGISKRDEVFDDPHAVRLSAVAGAARRL